MPKIYFHDPEEGLIWMQDLGHDDLWAYRAEPWEIRRPLYEAALTEVARMHTSATRRIEGASIRLEREFSEQLYLWEQGYFFEHCLGAHFGLDAATVQRYATLPALTGIADHLAHLPRVLVHRDFQSQNILIHQGARGSLISRACAPACRSTTWPRSFTIPTSPLRQRTRPPPRLLPAGRPPRGAGDRARLRAVYHECALQRLMQALGAYGFLGLHKGRADFLAHIPAARRSLREVAARLDGLDPFVKLLDSLP